MQLGILGNGIHPATKEVVAYQLDARFWGPQPDAVLGDLVTSKDVIPNPYRVFLTKPGYGEGYVLIAKPTYRYVDPLSAMPVRDRCLFIIYVNAGMTITDMGWVHLGLELPHLPADEAEEQYLSETFGQEI